MTLAQTSRWMQALGCIDAMNLDGGSSKRMVIGGRVVDFTSTEIVAGQTDTKHVRPVHSALLIYPQGTDGST
jgi:exopolysaccharide biosynthesis protein